MHMPSSTPTISEKVTTTNVPPPANIPENGNLEQQRENPQLVLDEPNPTLDGLEIQGPTQSQTDIPASSRPQRERRASSKG